jgi:two-component system cell cycle response regulator
MVFYLAAGGALVGAYVITTLAGAPDIVGIVLSGISPVFGLVAVVVGARRHRPASPCAVRIALAMLLVTIGSFFPSGVLAGTASPPSLADGFYLLSYAVAGIGLVLTVRRRTPSWSLPVLLDATMIAISAGLLTWIYLVDPILGNATVGLPTRLVAVAYPLGDLVLAALGARLLLDGGPKSVAVYAITGYLALTVVPDTLNTLDALAGQTRWTFVVSLLWMVDGLLLGVAGLHPSMRDIQAPSAVVSPDLGPVRLGALALATLLAPAALMIQYLRHAPLFIPLICATCSVLFLLAIGRLAGVVAVQRRMAVTDVLTGLSSRRYFEDASSGLARRRGRAAAVLMLDIDHFKRVNDTHGHDGGDQVLREVARRLSRSVRPGDVLARYGGEEFAVLLPNTTPADAWAVAERIRGAVCDHPVEVGEGVAITITVSIGVACRPADVPESGQLTPLADQMLYQAKQAGRNRVVAASTR